MQTLLQDVRYAARQLAHAPSFAIVAIVSLALGIGATTAIFSVIHGILIDPYPYKDNARMVHPVLYNERGMVDFLSVTGPQLEEIRHARSVDESFAYRNDPQTLTSGAFPISVLAGIYTPNSFEYFGVPPLLGREFTPADAPNGTPQPVAVLSFLFWKRQFAGQPDIVGKTIELNHKQYAVIGVLTPRFTWGDNDVYEIGVPDADPQIHWQVFFKIKPGVSRAAMNAELQPIVNEAAQDPNRAYLKGARINVKGLNEWLVGQFQGTLLLLFGAVGLLLAVACANVSILLLARGSARRHEFAVRRSLGAARNRIVRQLLTESLMLSLIGTGIGVLLAFGGIRLISAFLPEGAFPHEAAITINAPVLFFSVAISLLVGILFGMAPAWQLSRPQLGAALQGSANRTSTTRQGRFTRRALVASQITVTLLLLAGAGAAMRTFLGIIHQPLGFNPEHLLTFDLSLPKGAHPAWQDRVNAFDAARQAVEHTPGVLSAGMTQAWFPPFGQYMVDTEILGKTEAQKTRVALVHPKAFATLQVPLLSGRLFTDSETLGAAHVAVVNREFVRRFFPNQDAIGHSVRSTGLKVTLPDFVSAGGSTDWFQIVGVVGDVRNNGLHDPAEPAFFVPVTFVMSNDMSFWARTAGDPEAVVNALRTNLRQLSPNILVIQPHAVEYFLTTRGWGKERFITLLFAAFSVLALLLAAAGLYSVTSYGVSLRTREFAVRLALGANREHLLGLALTSEAIAVSVGLVVGLGLSVALGNVLRTWAGGSSRDPLVLGSVCLLLAVVAVLAAILPAKRAAALEPMQALRAE
ncbi:MAG: ABC transporter permease [Acidobacteria bacterium]|nr:ABC transporter permease [Acidobacteriota bacterium]